MIRVLLAEDSHTTRQLLAEILHGDGGIDLIGEAKDGREAVEMAERLHPDLILADVHMPVMDGLSATKQIMIRCPTPIVLVSSSADTGDVQLAFDAMRTGALVVIEKPDNPASARFSERRAQLLATIKAMSQVKVVRQWAPRGSLHVTQSGSPANGARRLRLVAIAASTGGPGALQTILAELPGRFPVPVLVVQHVAEGFAAGLASWLNCSCAMPVKLAEDGELLHPGVVYLAPDNRHLGVGAGGRAEVTASPPVAGFRPSGTILFESAAQAFGATLAAVILTGMGSDGVAGLRAVRAAGGMIIAQDESTSVVYGMPKEAVDAGLAHAVLPLSQIASRLVALSLEDRNG